LGNRLERRGSPRGLLRGLLRAPVWLYRAHLGFLLGRRFVMIDHTGRVTGRKRSTVLEVVAARQDAVYVMAAWGKSAEWYRNLLANPSVRVHHGSDVWPATAALCDEEVARSVLAEYADRHPWAFRRLGRLMLDEVGQSIGETVQRAASRLPVVAFPRP
jgi:deazaflavin-dependent oxidoreductase (nitroreductase family)